MSTFWIVSILLALLALVFIALPAYKFRQAASAPSVAKDSEEERQRQNVLIFKDRLAELEQDLASQKIDQTQFHDLKEELELALLADVEDDESHQAASFSGSIVFSLACAAVVIGASFVLYFQTGSYDKVLQHKAMQFDQTEMQQARRAAEQGDMSALLQQLYDKLQRTPDNLEGWMLLSRTALNVKRFDLALEGYEHVISVLEREGQNPASVYGMLAQAHYFKAGDDNGGGAMTPEVELALNKALTLNENETNSLSLYAIHAFDSKEYDKAVGYWEKVLVAEPDHPARDSIQAGIARAKSLSGSNSLAMPSSDARTDDLTKADDSKKEELAVGAKVGVTVSLDPKLADKVKPNDFVFIFARAESGPPMPLAASRHMVSELPITVTLDDSKAMAPMAKLSQVQTANIVARVSKSGQPIAQAGDLEGGIPSVSVWEGQSVSITIDTQL